MSEHTINTNEIRGYLVDDAAFLETGVLYDWCYLVEHLCYEIDKQRRMIEWLARQYAKAYAGEDDGMYEDRYTEQFIADAEKAVSEGE